MSARPFRQLLIGLPGTGKTTFLVALWHVVESGELGNALQLAELPPNRAQLNEFREAWFAGLEIPRTTPAAARTIPLILRDPQTGEIAEVFFPHMSGESFREQFEQRRCT